MRAATPSMKRDTLGDSLRDDANGEAFSIGVVDENFSYGVKFFSTSIFYHIV